MTSDFFQRMALLSALAAPATAAEVSLQGDGRLTGEVRSMEADGTIELASPLSSKPLRISAGQAVRVDFGSGKPSAHASGQTLQLRNGDLLPVRVESMSDGLLRAVSDDLGRFSIPREMISTIQLGIFPQRLIYSGPDDFKGWRRDKANPGIWTIEGGELVAKGHGTVWRDAELPEKFILRFNFAWEKHPYLKLGFAEPKDAASGSMDRYVFQYVGSGMGIFRESAGEKNNIPIISINRTVDRPQDSRVAIEIRVDRSRGQLQLYIDGEMEGRYMDPVSGIPMGPGISLSSMAANGSIQRISGIRVFEWDDRADRHRTEERGDGKSDSLIGRNGERLGGKLTGIRAEGGESVYLFKSDFQKAILELPEVEVSTVFVGGDAAPEVNHLAEAFVLSLRGGGQMTVASCVFGSDTVTATHPLLGEVKMDRAGITSLERRVSPKAKPVNIR